MGNEEVENNFKLLGIRPLKGCDSQFKKNLNNGEVYKFYQNYNFLDKSKKEISKLNQNLNNEIINVKTPEEYINLYSKDKLLQINISAIVGKNGSGKSSILELFFLAVYLIHYKKIIEHKKNTEDEFISIDKENSYNQVFNANNDYLNNHADGRTLRFFRGLRFFKNKRAYFEVLYEDKSNVYKLTIDTNLKDDVNWYKLKNLTDQTFSSDITNPLPFYSISLNYSIHSLNTLDMDVWLESIFHKNDGYQTPLVINPKREEGTIDISNERDLQKARLLVNTMDIMENTEDVDPLFNRKQIKKVVFKYKYQKSKSVIKGLDSIDGSNHNRVKKTQERLLQIQKVFDIKKYSDCSWIEKEAYGYLTYKTGRIIKNYSKIFNKDTFEDNLNKIKTYDSHITFKLKQAIKFINYQNYIKSKCEQKTPEIVKDYYGEGFDGYSFDEDPSINIEIINENDRLISEIYSLKINDIKEQINYLPPPIFDYDFHFSEDVNDTFEKLSSGEKQQVYSIHTIMYHLRNVSSVTEESGIIKYSKVNILLDEIELYFHPEMQRHFISRLIKGIEQLKKHFKNNINTINILVATHSPFILTDIPSINILRLKDGKTEFVKQQTFGANIHELLIDNFFMTSTIGEFSKEKINQFIKKLNETIKNRNDKKPQLLENSISDLEELGGESFINLIGDSLVKDKLLQMYFLATEKNDKEGLKKYYQSKLENLN